MLGTAYYNHVVEPVQIVTERRGTREYAHVFRPREKVGDEISTQAKLHLREMKLVGKAECQHLRGVAEGGEGGLPQVTGGIRQADHTQDLRSGLDECHHPIGHTNRLARGGEVVQQLSADVGRLLRIRVRAAGAGPGPEVTETILDGDGKLGYLMQGIDDAL